jgi:CheY-like chemotaxis protein
MVHAWAGCQASILTRASAQTESTERRGARRSLRILVIDDLAEARELYCAYLEFLGFRTDAAEDGAEGIAKARAAPPDAIVLDYSMPQMDGAQVLALLNADEQTRSIPVVMLTAAPALVGSKARALCSAFLEKPCEPDRLAAAIVLLMRARKQTH